MKVVDVKTMRALESAAICNYAVPSLILMENAAQGVVSSIILETGDVSGKKVHIFCGGGNNGGDGFAVARLLFNMGADVKITLVSEKSKIKGDAKINLDIAEKMGIPFVDIDDVCCDIIIDAIFGTGMHGETTGRAKECIEKINNSGAYVVAIDVPSGVSADSGHAAAVSVFADLLVTFSALKIGHLLFPGRNHYKKLIKADISIPKSVINNTESGYDVIDMSCLKLLPKRRPDSHKGSFGKALALVGGKGTSGAACLASSAILKSGAGMVTALVPETIYEIVAKHIPSTMVHPLKCENDTVSVSTLDEIHEKLSWADVALLGCGLGVSSASREIIFSIIKSFSKPLCLDADALNIIAEDPDILLEKKCNIILTPHIAEFSRLSGLCIVKIKENPIAAARDFAKKYGVTLVLKDAVTVVADKNGNAFISSASNSGLATAGSGDVLAGIITGLLAQGAQDIDAAVLGVYLHLAAGHIARLEKGEYSMTSEDVLNAIPYGFKNKTDISPDIKEL